ncbi:MAG: ROK family protein [Mycoplasmataceae bacterium]|nr:ROK family protein [Mycoplasmataceae bacterium]
MKILAMDMGGTFIKWALFDRKTFKILKKGRYATHAQHHSGLEIVWSMARFAQTMKDKYKDINCVCSTMVGIIDTNKYVVLSPNHTLKGYEGMHIKNEFSKYCKLPLHVMNDVKAAAQGELKFGSLKKAKKVNAIVMAIGTGIAGCPIIDSNIYMGATYASGECGQMLVNNHFYEMHYSVPALIIRCEKTYGRTLTGEQCLELAKTNVPIRHEVNRWFDGIIKGIMNYVYLFNPSYVVLGGKITEHKDFDLKVLKQSMMKLAKKPISSFEHVKIVKAQLGNDAALYGVASLALK